jgi:hypothetical protein
MLPRVARSAQVFRAGVQMELNQTKATELYGAGQWIPKRFGIPQSPCDNPPQSITSISSSAKGLDSENLAVVRCESI